MPQNKQLSRKGKRTFVETSEPEQSQALTSGASPYAKKTKIINEKEEAMDCSISEILINTPMGKAERDSLRRVRIFCFQKF